MRLWLTWTVRLSMALIGVLMLAAATSAPVHAAAHQDCLGAHQMRIAAPGVAMQTAMPAECGAGGTCQSAGLCHSGDCFAAPVMLATPPAAIGPRRLLAIHFALSHRIAEDAATAFDPPPPRVFA